jgi:anthranilate synthase/aminodeoxychorismate synthase-like glutamine amidotransferase
MRYIAEHWQSKPIFGVCLGHQALNEFFGGTLKYVRPIHGKARRIRHDGEGIFTALPNPMTVGRYHSLAVDVPAPPMTVTARAFDGTVMALRHRSLPIESVQFHPESILTPDGLQLIQNLAATLLK